MAYANLHTHSHISLMDATAKPEDIAKKVKDMGQSCFSLTEHGTVASGIMGYKAAKKHGLKYIFGVELYYVHNVNIKTRGLHIIFYVKNADGYYNLNKMMIEAYDNLYYHPRVDLKIVTKYCEGLICTTACMGGLGKDEVAMSDLYELFGDDFYIELHTNNLDGQKQFNNNMIKWAVERGLNNKLIPASDAHYINKEDADTHRKWISVGKEKEYYPTDDFYLHSDEDIIKYFGKEKAEKLIANQQSIINKCNFELTFGGQNYPKAFEGDLKDEVRKICWEGFKRKSIPTTKEYVERMKYELEVLDKSNYLNYFLITQDILSHCDEKGIGRGVGRGSVAGSLVAYSMGITNIDPIKENLIFERFAHLERITNPDIDNDISKEKRKEVIEYIVKRYGQVYHVMTYNYMGDKGALKRACQALNIEPKTADSYSKLLGEAELESYSKANIPKQVLELARKFKGILQNFSCHASAILVFPQEPHKWTAIEKRNEEYIVASDFHDLEEMGLLKLDILGLATVDIIHEVTNKCKIDWSKVDTADKKTFDMLAIGDSAGVFQIESDGMTDVTKRLAPKKYQHLIPIVALFRPGPRDSGMMESYIRRVRGEEEVVYLHPKLEAILKDTYGIIVYQEQIQEICSALCGYTFGEGDMLRRVIGRKETEKMEGAINEFIEKGIKNGIDEHTIREIADQIKTFSLYGFNKAHAAAYGYLSFQTAYLKANYPLEFACALLNSKIGDTEKTAVYYQSFKNKVKINPPDIEMSEVKHTIKEGEIWFGLSAIKGIGDITLNKRTKQITDFIIDNPELNKRTVESLVKAGTFGDGIGRLLGQIDATKDRLKRIQQCVAKIKEFKDKDNHKKVDEWTSKLIEARVERIETVDLEVDALSAQQEVLGFTFEDKLQVYDNRLAQKYNDVELAEVITFKPWKTKGGKPMAFVKVRHNDKVVDAVMFNDKKLVAGNVYLMKLDENKILDFTPADSLTNEGEVCYN